MRVFSLFRSLSAASTYLIDRYHHALRCDLLFTILWLFFVVEQPKIKILHLNHIVRWLVKINVASAGMDLIQIHSLSGWVSEPETERERKNKWIEDFYFNWRLNIYALFMFKLCGGGRNQFTVMKTCNYYHFNIETIFLGQFIKRIQWASKNKYNY